MKTKIKLNSCIPTSEHPQFIEGPSSSMLLEVIIYKDHTYHVDEVAQSSAFVRLQISTTVLK